VDQISVVQSDATRQRRLPKTPTMTGGDAAGGAHSGWPVARHLGGRSTLPTAACTGSGASRGVLTDASITSGRRTPRPPTAERIGGKFPWGRAFPPPRSLRQLRPHQDGFQYTAPVGSFPPNAVCLNDLAGNRWEWIGEGCARGGAYLVRGAGWNAQNVQYLDGIRSATTVADGGRGRCYLVGGWSSSKPSVARRKTLASSRC
jgi:hypothetical protein